VTRDGLPHVFATNTLSAYILTALIERPHRLVYLSSGMHHHARANLDDILWSKRRWNGSTPMLRANCTMLCWLLLWRVAGVMCVVTASSLVGCQQKWGPNAPDDMDQAHLTQAWLAASRDSEADVTGKYFYHMKRMRANPQAHDVALQDRLIDICTEISGIALPEQ
jgi:hypothetical protein